MTRTIKQYTMSIRTNEAFDAAADAEALDDANSALDSAEDVVNDWLAEGYYCKIEDV